MKLKGTNFDRKVLVLRMGMKYRGFFFAMILIKIELYALISSLNVD